MAAQSETRNVWVQLRQGGSNVGDVDELEVGANVARLRNAVKDKFKDSKLRAVDSNDLTVSRSADSSDTQARLRPDAAVPSDTSYERPLFIHFEAPPSAAPGARRPRLARCGVRACMPLATVSSVGPVCDLS
jgi:hypothetical protein